MQKNYRDFTVGELLDLGLNVDVRKHNITTDEEGIKLTRMFEGCKQTTHQLKHSKLKTYHAWKEQFEATFFS